MLGKGIADTIFKCWQSRYYRYLVAMATFVTRDEKISIMVLISVEMVRRRAEHNEKEIGTLEELSLHQENIEKIDHLQHWCRNLQILLLQSNLIQNIENLGKLKRLRYLNLALNNIEIVQNLEGLESLEKLDLTLNFIGCITSIAKLNVNHQLRNLILTGNPCVDFRHYREYVITKLPQITELDCKEITRSERILAKQQFHSKERKVEEDEATYSKKRQQEKIEENEVVDHYDEDTEFWNKPSKNTPEERIRIAKETQKTRKTDEKDRNKLKKEVRLFNQDGKPLNINQSKIPFKIYDDEQDGTKVLDIAIYRYLDTSYVDVDVQPTSVTVRIKGKILQIVLDDEVIVGSTICRRSQATGHLEIRMPKQHPTPYIRQQKPTTTKPDKGNIGNPLLEVTCHQSKLNLAAIVNEENWKDDPNVPPLE